MDSVSPSPLPGNRQFKPKKGNNKQNQVAVKRKNKNKKNKKQQSKLAECFGFDDVKGALSEAIEASGDTLQDKGKGNVQF